MSATLSYTDIIQRTGYTIVDDVKVVQYTLVLPLNDPMKMRVTATRLNPEMYKEHRDICRADNAEFEDAAYALQEEMLAKMNKEE